MATLEELEARIAELEAYIDTSVFVVKDPCETVDPCDDNCPKKCCQKCFDTLTNPLTVPVQLAAQIEFCDPDQFVGLCFLLSGANGKQAYIRVTDHIEDKAVVEFVEATVGDILTAPITVFGPTKCDADSIPPTDAEICASVASECPITVDTPDDCIKIYGSHPNFSISVNANALADKICDICTPPDPTVAYIKGIVWEDQNNDGDPSTDNLAVLGLGGYTVNMWDVTGGPVDIDIDPPDETAITNSFGEFSLQISPFAGPITYRVAVDATSHANILALPGISTEGGPIDPDGEFVADSRNAYEFVLNDLDCNENQYFPYNAPFTAAAYTSEACIDLDGDVTWQTSSEVNVLGWFIYCNGVKQLPLVIASGPATYKVAVSPACPAGTVEVREVDLTSAEVYTMLAGPCYEEIPCDDGLGNITWETDGELLLGWKVYCDSGGGPAQIGFVPAVNPTGGVYVFPFVCVGTLTLEEISNDLRVMNTLNVNPC